MTEKKYLIALFSSQVNVLKIFTFLLIHDCKHIRYFNMRCEYPAT